MSARSSDRVAGVIFLAISIWYWIEAGNYTVAYGDPAGPGFVPHAIAVPMGLLAAYLIIRPDPDPVWIRWPHVVGQAASLVVLLVYPLLIEPMGFPLATILGSALLARILGASWLQSVISGVVVGVGLFILFDIGFNLPLPLGPIFG
jgi:putative tricarboxylic transport membrane protein